MSDVSGTTRASRETEETLLLIVRGLLRNEAIEPDDDFFLVGGYSLLGTQLVIRARKAFGVKLALHDLLDASTVARLAVRVEALIVEEIEALSEQETMLGVTGRAA